jgi:DNA-binding NarL/FixJ family response regulator
LAIRDLSLAKTQHEAILVHVTCYTASLYVIDFTCALDFGEAQVQKAVELKPDLVLMDIGLPSQNGVETARQIFNLVSGIKILFLSQESSPDVIQEALSLGASGYVVKVNAGIDLLPAIEAGISRKQFVSSCGSYL